MYTYVASVFCVHVSSHLHSTAFHVYVRLYYMSMWIVLPMLHTVFLICWKYPLTRCRCRCVVSAMLKVVGRWDMFGSELAFHRNLCCSGVFVVYLVYVHMHICMYICVSCLIRKRLLWMSHLIALKDYAIPVRSKLVERHR